MKNFLRILIVWLTLLAVPLQGFALTVMPLCSPASATAQQDQASMDDKVLVVHGQDGQIAAEIQSDHQHPAAHHHKVKCATCATCATCGSCVAMAPSFTSVVPPSTSLSLTVALDQRILTSVDLALPERPPRA